MFWSMEYTEMIEFIAISGVVAWFLFEFLVGGIPDWMKSNKIQNKPEVE